MTTEWNYEFAKPTNAKNHPKVSKKQVSGRVIKAIGLFMLCAFFVACSSNGSKTDATVEKFKVWDYGEIGNMYEASVLSKNYFQSTKGENLYLCLSVSHPPKGSDICYIAVHVYGTPDGEVGSVINFPPSLDKIVVSFDGEGLTLWHGTVFNSIFVITQSSEFIERLKISNTCIISVETDYGEMKCHFNTSNLDWN